MSVKTFCDYARLVITPPDLFVPLSPDRSPHDCRSVSWIYIRSPVARARVSTARSRPLFPPRALWAVVAEPLAEVVVSVCSHTYYTPILFCPVSTVADRCFCVNLRRNRSRRPSLTPVVGATPARLVAGGGTGSCGGGGELEPHIVIAPCQYRCRLRRYVTPLPDIFPPRYFRVTARWQRLTSWRRLICGRFLRWWRTTSSASSKTHQITPRSLIAGGVFMRFPVRTVGSLMRM